MTIRWKSGPPTPVDERLTLVPDGPARLVVAQGRVDRDTIGVYEWPPEELLDAAEVARVRDAGDLVFDIAGPPSPERDLAERLAAALRQHPHAIARFALAAGGPSPAGRAVTLGVGNPAEASIAFDLDVAQCAVDFYVDGQAVGWVPFPELPTGFVTADAAGLGGVRMRAGIGPDVVGVIVFDLAVPAAAREFAGHVAGRLFLPDDPMPLSFAARTATVPL